MKLKHLIFLLMIVMVTQSKKCKNVNPPTVQPPPSPTKETKPLVLPLDNGTTSGNGSGTIIKYHYPNMGGTNQFPNDCEFTTQDIASIRVKIKYWELDANNNIIEQVYSDEMYSNSAITIPVGTLAPELNISVPESGYYWVEIEYTFADCNDCCGKFKSANTGVIGCDATTQTNNIYQGKPKIFGKTEYTDWTLATKIGWFTGWEEFDFTCICNCL
jgi:hypothetical protein